MTKININNTTPTQLNWLVAKCLYPKLVIYLKLNAAFKSRKQEGIFLPDFNPSTNWAQGGPIVEKELINLITTAGYPWRATMYMGGGVWIDQHGPTPLIAAMRCYVVSKLGDTVEITEELL